MSAPKDVAERFNKRFSSIASDIKVQNNDRTTFDPDGLRKFLGNSVSNSMVLEPADESEVRKIVYDLKNKATLDTKIPALKSATMLPHFITALTRIVNLSFDQGIFPSEFKTARVVPIHKSGSRLDVLTIGQYLYLVHSPKFTKS